MSNLNGTKTHENLKAAFAGESQANRRYLYFAKVADIEGYPEIASNFRETAEGETGHAHGHLDYLKDVGDPATGLPIGDTLDNLKAAVAGETHNTQICIPAWPKQHERTVLLKLLIGLKHWQKPKNLMLAGSNKWRIAFLD